VDTQSIYGRGTGALKALWNGENGNRLRAIFADDFEFHNLDGGNDVTDLKGLRQRMAELAAAHPGARLQVESTIGSGSHITFDWSLRDATPGDGRARREGSPPIIRDGFIMVRFDGDCVAELWELTGSLAN
jgi:hypothetical protein